MATENAGASTEIVKDPPSFDRSALESTVSDGLAALFGDDTPDETPETVGEPTEEIPVEETPVEEEQPTEEVVEQPTEEATEAVAKPAATPAKKPAAAASNAPTLPAAHVRSLKAYGWEDAEIADNLKALGSKFLDTAARIHKNRNDEINGWAEAGRKARTTDAEQQIETSQQQQPAKPAPVKPALVKVDAAALKAKYGDDALIDALVNPVNAVVDQINAILPQVQQTQQRSHQAEIDALSRQVDAFFGGKEMKPYESVYGTATAPLNNEQVTTRNKVLETADALMAGAKMQGRQLTLGDAMQLAHDSVSSGFKTQAVRNEIKGKLMQRAAGIVLKPSGKNPAAAKSGTVSTRKDLETKVSQGLKAVFA